MTELQSLQNDIDQAVASTKRRNAISLVLALVVVALIGFWLYNAHRQFTKVDPDFAAQYLQAKSEEYLPQASTDLEKSLKDYAPSAVNEMETRLQAVPDRFANELTTRTKAELDKAMPELQDELYKSMKAALDQGKSNLQGANDEAKLKNLLAALADTYQTESIKLVDRVQASYVKNGSDIVAYIKILGENKNLDRRQQLHRDMIQQFLVVATQQGTPQVLPAATK